MFIYSKTMGEKELSWLIESSNEITQQNEQLHNIEDLVRKPYERTPSKDGVYIRKDQDNKAIKNAYLSGWRTWWSVPLVFFDIYDLSGKLVHKKKDYFSSLTPPDIYDDASRYARNKQVYTIMKTYDPAFRSFIADKKNDMPAYLLRGDSIDENNSIQHEWYISKYANTHNYVFMGDKFTSQEQIAKRQAEEQFKNMTSKKAAYDAAIGKNPENYKAVSKKVLESSPNIIHDRKLEQKDLDNLKKMADAFFLAYPNGTTKDFYGRLPWYLQNNPKEKYEYFGIFWYLLNTKDGEFTMHDIQTMKEKKIPLSIILWWEPVWWEVTLKKEQLDVMRHHLNLCSEIVLNATLQPNPVLNSLYYMFWIEADRMGVDPKLWQNNFMQNITKGLLDEIFAVETLVEFLLTDFRWFVNALKKALLNIGDTLSTLKDQYTQFTTINFRDLSDPRDQYVLGQQAMQIFIMFLPWWVAAKIGKIAKVSTKTAHWAVRAASFWPQSANTTRYHKEQ